VHNKEYNQVEKTPFFYIFFKNAKINSSRYTYQQWYKNPTKGLKVIPAGKDLLAGRAEEEGMLELGNVGPLDVDEGGMGVEDTHFH
jgi:hypothetical protein